MEKGVFTMSYLDYTPIFAAGRIIGKVEGDTFYKTIASNHYLKKPPAIAFDVSSLDDAENAGAKRVEVKDRETGLIYQTTIKHIRAKGFKFNRGYGEQVGLSMNGWSKYKSGGGIQLGLF
jgi:hypothetical protein